MEVDWWGYLPMIIRILVEAEPELQEELGATMVMDMDVALLHHLVANIKEATLARWEFKLGDQEEEGGFMEVAEALELVGRWREQAEDRATSEAVTAPAASPPQDPQPWAHRRLCLEGLEMRTMCQAWASGEREQRAQVRSQDREATA